MNDDLLISIGADLSSFQSALKVAEKKYNEVNKNLNNKSMLQLRVDTQRLAKSLKSAEDKLRTSVDKMTESLRIDLQVDADDKKAMAQVRRIAEQSVKMVADAERKNKKEIIDNINAINKERGLAIQKDIKNRKKESDVARQLLKQRVADYKKAKEEEVRVEKETSERKKRLAHLIWKNKQRLLQQEIQTERETASKEIAIRKAKIDKIMAQYRSMSREKQAIELNRIRRLSDAELNAQVRLAKSKIGTPQKTSWDFSGHRGLIDSTLVVAKYGAISQALYGLQSAFRNTITTGIEFNNMMYQNMAVLNVTDKELNTNLINTVKKLGSTYGGTISEIQEGLITIGRAGVDAGKGLEEATKVIKEMAMITGDSMKAGADVMSSFINVFKLSGTEIQDLGNQMMYVANATRLSLEDFSTFSNYALVTAKTLNMTKESTLALAGAFSKVGLNASTIGTSLARLSKIALESTDANLGFFREVGISQEQFAKDLQDKSGKGLERFMTQLQKMGEERFSKAIKDLPELMKRTVIALKEAGGEAGFYAKMLGKLNGELEDTSIQAEKMAQGFTPTMESMRNSFYIAVEEGIQPFLQSVTDLVRELNLAGNGSVETFKNLLSETARYAKLLVEVALSAWAYTAIGKIGALATAFGTLKAEIWATRAAMLALQNLPLVLAAAGGALAYEAITYDMKMKEGGYDSDEQRKAMLAKRDERIELELLAKTYTDADTKAKYYAESLKRLEELNTNGSNDVAIANLKKQIAVQKDITFNLEKYWGMHKEATADIIKANGEAADALAPLVYQDTPKQIAEQKKMLLQQQAIRENLTSEQIARREIAIDIEAQTAAVKAQADLVNKTGGVVGSKEELALRKELAKLTELELRQKRLLQRQSEKSAGSSYDKNRQEIRDAKARLRYLEEIHKQTILQAKIDAGGTRGLSKIEERKQEIKFLKDALDLQKLAVTEAKKEWDKKKDSDELKQKYAQAYTKELEIQLKLVDLQRTAWDDIVANFKDALSDFSTAFREGGMEALAESVQGFVAGAVDTMKNSGNPLAMAAGYAIDIIAGLMSNVPTQAELDAAKGRVEFDDESFRALADAFSDAQYPMLEVTHSMNKYLRSMEGNFGYIAKALTGTSVGTASLTGEGYIPIYEEVLGGIWGGTTSKLLGSGIQFLSESITELIAADVNLIRGYITEAVTEESWFGLVEDTSIRYRYSALEQSVIDSFSEAIGAGFDAILLASESLGFDADAIREQLEAAAFVIGDDSGMLSLEGLSDDEVAERLSDAISGAFSGVLDTVMEIAPLIDRYTKIGEEALETLGRIAFEYDQASFSFMLIGKTFEDAVYQVTENIFSTVTNATEGSSWFDGWTGLWDNVFTGFTGWFGLVRDSISTVTSAVTTMTTVVVDKVYTAQMQILDIVESAGGMDSFNDAMTSFMTNFYDEAEQLEFMQKALAASFNTLGISMPKTNDEFRYLLETMDTSTEEGAYLYGQVLLLAESFAAMSDAAENLNGSLDETLQALADAWLGELSYLTNAQKTAFAENYYDIIKDLQTVNEEVRAVDAARSAAEAALRTSATKEDYMGYFERYANELEREIPDDRTLTDVVNKLDDVLNAIKEADDNQLRSIQDVRIVT